MNISTASYTENYFRAQDSNEGSSISSQKLSQLSLIDLLQRTS